MGFITHGIQAGKATQEAHGTMGIEGLDDAVMDSLLPFFPDGGSIATVLTALFPNYKELDVETQIAIVVGYCLGSINITVLEV